MSDKITAYFDGACWPNPNGHAGAGCVVKRCKEVIYSGSKYLGRTRTSNNVAEYEGLILILEYLIENKIDRAHIFGDSNLVIMQITGKWKVKRQKQGLYLPSYDKARALANKLPLLKYTWIPREQNEEADEMSTLPLRQRGIRNPFAKEAKASTTDCVKGSSEAMDALFKNAI